jgi:hypothetical protein
MAKTKITKIAVKLVGLSPIMFDRYIGMTGQEVAPEQKFYLAQDEKTITLPSVNISSFLSADLTESATKRVMGRKWRGVAKAALSYVNITPVEIPFTRDGVTLTLDNANYTIDKRVARVKKSGGLIVPSEKVRPVLGNPWELSFNIELFENAELNEPTLRRIFEEGGISIGLGTFRGVFGKFSVASWETK